MTADFDVSIIVPARNEESSIRAVIEALLNQTVSAREILIADGGSTDKTKDIVREFIRKGYSIRLLEDRDAFPGRARNLAIEAAQTHWIAMTDAGTMIEPDWLENLIRQAKTEKATDVVLGTYEPILDSFFKQCLALSFIDPGKPIGHQYLRGPSTASLLMQRRVWEGLGKFPEQLRACEDLLFFEKLNSSSFTIRYAPDAVVRWQIPDSFAKVFRRFKLYSLYTLKAGLGRQWHLAIGRMYVVGAVFIFLAMVHQIWWLGLPLLGFLLRIHRTIRVRKPSLNLLRTIGPLVYLLVGIMILWIDLAAWAGLVDYIRSRMRPRNTNISVPCGEDRR